MTPAAATRSTAAKATTTPRLLERRAATSMSGELIDATMGDVLSGPPKDAGGVDMRVSYAAGSVTTGAGAAKATTGAAAGEGAGRISRDATGETTVGRSA